MGTTYTMSKLNELTAYCCRVRSKNEAGEGEFSKPKTFHTKARPPPVIKSKLTFYVYSASFFFNSSGFLPFSEKKLFSCHIYMLRLSVLFPVSFLMNFPIFSRFGTQKHNTDFTYVVMVTRRQNTTG